MESVSSGSPSSQLLDGYTVGYSTRREQKGAGVGEGCDAVSRSKGWWLNARQLYSFSSPNTVLGPEGQSPALPSFSAAFCKAPS